MDKILFEYHMKKNGYTQRTLARVIGITEATLSRKLSAPEGGKRYDFTQSEIKAVAQILHLTPEDVWRIFFDGEEETRQ